jgi:hypothetical protein
MKRNRNHKKEPSRIEKYNGVKECKYRTEKMQ